MVLGLVAALCACSIEPPASLLPDANPGDAALPDTPPREEDCGASGDEDGNGVSDCRDPVCSRAPACAVACGDGRLDANEQCDDGNLSNGDGCERDCTLPFCGNGIRDDDEHCDDGNLSNGDGCENDCTLPGCGNGIVDESEECDDSNRTNSDGCESDCTLPFCGNGVLDDDEHCDDGNLSNGDGCENDCTLPSCGNGIVDWNEQCDDGNQVNNDGCNSTCDHSAYTYIKASNPGVADVFGSSVAISLDGSTMAVGAPGESSSATRVNGDQSDDTMRSAGAVYVFVRDGGSWVQQAYLKGSIAIADGEFGWSVALAADGSTIAVGAPSWDRPAGAGAAYVFTRNEGIWEEAARLTVAAPGAFNALGFSVALSGDGRTLAVGDIDDASNATGIDGDPDDRSMEGSGAVHVFSRASGTWTHQAYVKASNTRSGAGFGGAVALSGDGALLVAAASADGSGATGVDGDQTNHAAPGSGAAYTFTRTGATWAQQAYIKASNTDSGDNFGASVALSADGSTIAVSAVGESSAATGINGNQASEAASASGATYVFVRGDDTWVQQAYIKASNTAPITFFGWSVALSADGSALAVGAEFESSAATGIDGDQHDTSAFAAGAVYRFAREDAAWHQAAYIKATNTGEVDVFGAAVALSADATLVVGAFGESSDASGVGGDQTNERAGGSGAVYVIE